MSMSSDSDNGELYNCPAKGCEYGPVRFNSLTGHYSSKTDGLHPGGINRVRELVLDSPSDASEPVQQTPAENKPPREGSGSSQPDEPQQTHSEADTGDRSTDPTMGSAEPQREPQPQGGHQQSGKLEASGDDPVCQRCGGELYDFRQFESGRYHRVNGEQVFVAGDFQCSSCAEWWEWRTDL